MLLSSPSPSPSSPPDADARCNIGSTTTANDATAAAVAAAVAAAAAAAAVAAAAALPMSWSPPPEGWHYGFEQQLLSAAASCFSSGSRLQLCSAWLLEECLVRSEKSVRAQLTYTQRSSLCMQS
jgi:hypothetical protein